MSSATRLLRSAAAVTFVVASAARSVSADRGPLPWDCVAKGTCCFVQKPALPTPQVFLPVLIDVAFDALSLGETGLERTQVRRALRRQSSAIEPCFPPLGGSADVVFVIGPAGGAHSAVVTTQDRVLAKCLAHALTRIAFPIAEDHTVTEVHVTIRGHRR